MSPLKATGTLVAAAPGPRSILNPLGVRVAPGGGVVVIMTSVRPNSDSAEFFASVVFKLQLMWC